MKIKRTYPSPEIQEGVDTLKSLGATRVAQEIEKQIFLTMQKGGALFHIGKQLEEEIDKARGVTFFNSK